MVTPGCDSFLHCLFPKKDSLFKFEFNAKIFILRLVLENYSVKMLLKKTKDCKASTYRVFIYQFLKIKYTIVFCSCSPCSEWYSRSW